MSILYVKRDNDKVVITIETDLPNNCDGTITTALPFTWQLSQPYLADLLVRYIRDRIKTAVSDARRESYEQGWKDARSKKQKADWFSGVL